MLQRPNQEESEVISVSLKPATKSDGVKEHGSSRSGEEVTPNCVDNMQCLQQEIEDSPDKGDSPNRRRFCDILSSPKFKNSPRLYWILLAVVLVTMIAVALILGLFLGLSHHLTRAQMLNLTVDLGYSKYVGVDEDGGVTKWLGIRYAAPPTGELRFRAPSDPISDDKTHHADKHAALCHSTPSTALNPNTTEDCLFLDVYAPSSKPGLHPVYVFIQGGGLNILANPNLDGGKLVRAGDFDIVVVTFNYRVGPFGFLASKEIKSNGDLNVGLLDQRKVFEWIQKHINKFGGDPDHVTLGGSSAGAGSVALHLTAYSGRNDGLFHAAAAGSPSFGAKQTVEGLQYQYDTLVDRVNCSSSADTLQCLRDLDISILAEHNQVIPVPESEEGYPVFTYSNVIDGNFSVDNTYSLLTDGKFIKVPIIFGDDTNEGTIFTPSAINTTTEMNHFLKNNFPKLDQTQMDRIDKFYPRAQQFPDRGEYWCSAANAYGEMRYTCPGIHINSQFSNYGALENWNFHWDVLENKNALSGLGVTHTADLTSIWGTSVPPEKELIPTIQSYWTSFIRTYNPNTYRLKDAPEWKPFSADSMLRLHFVTAANVSMEAVDSEQWQRCSWLQGESRALGI